MPRLVFEDDSPILHWRVVEVHPVEQNTNNACGKITPQWRLSLKKKKIWGSQEIELFRDKHGFKKKTFGETTNAGLSKLWASYYSNSDRHGDGGVFGAETRQERIHTVDKTVCSTRSRSNPLFVQTRRSKARYIAATRIHSYCNYGTIARKWLNIFLRTVPLESLGTCVKAAAPQCPSPSSHGNKSKPNKSPLTWNIERHKVSFRAPFPSDLAPDLLLFLHQWEMQ